MRYRIYIILLIITILAAGASAVFDASLYWTVGWGTAALLVCIMLYRSISKPLRAVENGMYLLREQDFSSRLRRTGQPDADRIVELYNTLIDSMKAERLKNLEQDRLLSLLVEASPLGIAICNFDGEIVQTNQAWDKMHSPALSKAISEVNDGETQTVRLADALIVRISRLWFMDTGFRRRFILVERLSDEIAAAEKQMFNKIVRTIGHEVNNTLGSVISVLESLEDIHSDDELAVAALSSSRNSCANLVGFVSGYADIVKLPPVQPEHISLNAWLASLLPTLSGMAPQNISVEFDAPEGNCEAAIDPMLMERVVINIVKNSIDSISDRAGGEIRISLERVGGSHLWRLRISDNGSGISEEAAAKLFTPFFSTKRHDRGLGLMLIADILRAHRFPFSLKTSESTRLTTFSIDI